MKDTYSIAYSSDPQEREVRLRLCAGNILREVSSVTGGKGGGRPDSAMSGGKDISKIAEALALVEALLNK